MASSLEPLYLETDEAEDVAGSVRHALACWKLVQDDPHAYKWMLLSLHSALQGSCVCHLTTTFAPVGAVTHQNTREWLQWSENRHADPDLKIPKTRIADLPELLKRVRKLNSAGGPCTETDIPISDSDLSHLAMIHTELRNQFTHFQPMSWAVEMSGIPAIATLVSRIVTDIQSCGWAFRHKDADWHSRFSNNLILLQGLS